MTDWDALTRRTLEGIETCDPIYRPTTYWGHGVRRLLDDMDAIGLDSFKSWPTASIWFYPTYGNGFTPATIESTFEHAASVNPAADKAWFATALNGAFQARRDFDAARLAWDQTRWPFDLERLGESETGRPPQFYRLLESKRVGWTRPYLNYLLCLAALSRYLDRPPASFLEIGGGYGVLGEIVMSRDPEARYVNLDLPPLVTVSSYYLDDLFDGRVTVYDASIPDSGPISATGSACLPNWRICDVQGPFDVFFNSFSFQEMEPDVVGHYVNQVAAKDVSYVVSLNSRRGKPRATNENDIGVIEQVTSDRIVSMFEARGYELLGRHGDPLVQSSSELVVLRRKGLTPRPATVLLANREADPSDYRRRGAAAPPKEPQSPPSRGVRLARDWLPPKLLRGLRRLRTRIR
jgi:putative sugar O-methyltransferase